MHPDLDLTMLSAQGRKVEVSLKEIAKDLWVLGGPFQQVTDACESRCFLRSHGSPLCRPSFIPVASSSDWAGLKQTEGQPGLAQDVGASATRASKFRGS